MNGNNARHSRNVASKIAATPSKDTGVFSGIWHWINGVANGVTHFIGTTLFGGFKTVQQALDVILGAFEDWQRAIIRVQFWLPILIWHIGTRIGERIRAESKANLNRAVRYLVRLIYVSTRAVLQLALHAVAVERAARIKEVAHAETLARQENKALHLTIEREAASGYQADEQQRADLIVRLLDFAATRNPELSGIVSDIAGGVLDLLEVDDPVLRFTLGFLMREVIDRLGIDKAVGDLISGLLDTLTGGGPPRDLHAVVMDISQRLAVQEQQWAQFFTDGGSQVEQAGTDWKNITSVIGNAAIVAFTVQAATDPHGWSAEIADTVGAAANDLFTKAASLFGG
jgi:hypothetical protein